MTGQPSLIYIPRLNSLPLRERPAYRVGYFGPEPLSTHELLAAVIGGDRQLEVAWTLLERYGSLHRLAQASVDELAQVPGIGPARAAALKAALALGQRMTQETAEERPKILSPADAAMLLIPKIGHQEQECLHVLFLNARRQVLGGETLYKGTLTETSIRTGEIFREAVRRNCASIIVGHNHPSGDLTPSPEDIALTRDLVRAGWILDIEMLDHLVIGGYRWISLRERGLGFDGGER